MLSLCPQPSAGTQIKKWNTDSTDFTRIGLFTDPFFDNISSVIFGFYFWFSRICKCWGTSFWVYDREMYKIECYLMLFRRKGVPQALANPRKSENKSNNHLPTKKISEKAKSVSSVQSVFKFLSIAVGWWTHYSHWYIYSLLLLCPQPSAGPQIKKMKHG